MIDKLAFKIYLTQECFTEKRQCEELFEKIEDAIANLLTGYELEGKIDDNLTGNTITFPVMPIYFKHKDKKCVVIESSHGIFYADVATGIVIGKEICCDKQPRDELCNDAYTQIHRFDFEEWKGYYKKNVVNTHVDILDLGYWLKNCLYTPAEEDFRKDIKAG